jgi:hypothetical protein
VRVQLCEPTFLNTSTNEPCPAAPSVAVWWTVRWLLLQGATRVAAPAVLAVPTTMMPLTAAVAARKPSLASRDLMGTSSPGGFEGFGVDAHVEGVMSPLDT